MFVSTRAEVALLYDAGCTQAEIARRLGVSKSSVFHHVRALGHPVVPRPRYDWRAVQAYYDAGHSKRECIAYFGFSSQTWHNAVCRGDLTTRPHAMPISVLLAAPRNRAHLKLRLLKAGLLDPACRRCGLTHWRGRPISLELHHVNGKRDDNRLENLALLCPNCHSQTDSWGGRNRAGARSGRALKAA